MTRLLVASALLIATTANAAPHANAEDAAAARIDSAHQQYVAALHRVWDRDPTCKPAFAQFDALGVTLPFELPRDAELRADCEIVAGDCTGRAFAALLASRGVGATAIHQQVVSEIEQYCSLATGTWRERVPRLKHYDYIPELPMSLRRLAAVESIAHDAGQPLGDPLYDDFVSEVYMVAESLARYASHCADARRAPGPIRRMTTALKTCVADPSAP